MELREGWMPATYLEIQELEKSQGELILRLDALYRMLEEMEKRIKKLERDDQGMTGWTVTPAPVWDA